MVHENKNRLLDLYFKEGTKWGNKRTRNHVQKCLECNDYLKDLEETDIVLRKWGDEPPNPHTMEMICDIIPDRKGKESPSKCELPLSPFIHIFVPIVFIILFIFFIQTRITLLPIWKSIEDMWLVQIFGRFGITTILFFTISTFITLSLTPFLFNENRSKIKKRLYF